MPPDARVRHVNPGKLPPTEAARLTDRVGTLLRLYWLGDQMMAHVQWDRRPTGGNKVKWSVPLADLVLAEGPAQRRGG